MGFWKRLFGGAKEGTEAPKSPAPQSDPSVFKCKQCGRVTTHSQVEEQYAGPLWLCECGYKSYRPRNQ